MDLTPFEWFQIVASIAAFITAVAVYLGGRDRAVAVSEAVIDERLTAFNTRLLDAGAQTSKLASYVQSLPTKSDIDTLWHSVDELRKGETRIRERLASLEQRA